MQKCFSQKLNRAENPGTRIFGAPPDASKKRTYLKGVTGYVR